MTIRTRFAPSPTGYLHIGGVRTALFNWLLTQRHGGQFILRIDDTDAERNRPEALQPILDGFQWLGITWDEGPTADGRSSVGPHAPYFQGQRNDRYVAAAVRLLEAGHAYPDYSTKDEVDADRVAQAVAALRAKDPSPAADAVTKETEAALKGQRPFAFRGTLRDNDPADNARRYREKPAALRFKVPTGRTLVVTDLIRARTWDGGTSQPGKVEFQTDLMGDPVILRAPGADGVPRPLYNFATVVDDLDFRVTHVVRAVEHFANTPPQVLFYEALGAEPPAFAHVPVVNEPKSSNKLSKRKMAKFMTPEVIARLRAVHAVPADWTDDQVKAHEVLNPATVEFYRTMGYLPGAVLNYLGRLGWSLDDKAEIIPLPEMVAHFGLERVNDSPASFDPDKLAWVAGEYMRRLPQAEKLDGCLPFLRRAGLVGDAIDAATRAKLAAVLEFAAERIKLFTDVIYYAAPVLKPMPEYDPKAVADKLRKPGVGAMLREYAGVLRGLDPFDADHLKATFAEFAAAKGLKLKDLDGPVRVAVTGVTTGFGLYETMALVGKEWVLTRLDHAAELAQQ